MEGSLCVLVGRPLRDAALRFAVADKLPRDKSNPFLYIRAMILSARTFFFGWYLAIRCRRRS